MISFLLQYHLFIGTGEMAMHCALFFLICLLHQARHHVSRPHQLHPDSHNSQTQSLLSIPAAATHMCNNYPNPNSNPLYTVICFEGNVTQLHISGHTLLMHTTPNNFSSHSLFTSLATNLPTLKVLSLVSRGLHGPLPLHIAALPSLEILDVTSNNFTGTIPIQLSSIKTLHTLILDHNLLTGELPNWIKTLPLLTTLSLSYNSFQRLSSSCIVAHG